MACQNRCKCCNLKLAVIVIAIVSLIFFACCFCGVLYCFIDETQRGSKDAVNFGYLLIPICFELVLYSCSLYGVIKEKKNFILPVLIVEAIVWVVGGICGIVFLGFPLPSSFTALMSLGLIAWSVKCRYYITLTKSRRPSDEIPVVVV